MANPLTAKQKRILDTIRELNRLYNRMPTLIELADKLGYKSVNSIQQYLKSLKDKGYLDIEPKKSRGLKLLSENTELVNIPLVGKVACGLPVFAEENIEAFIPVDRQLIGKNLKSFFFLSAQGDSMDKAGIDDQDLLLFESKQTANSGEIIVVLIGDEATVKYFKPSNDYIALLPKSSNPIHKPIILTSNFSIQGVLRRVFKKKDLT